MNDNDSRQSPSMKSALGGAESEAFFSLPGTPLGEQAQATQLPQGETEQAPLAKAGTIIFTKDGAPVPERKLTAAS